MDIILRLFSLAGVFVSFGEGVWRRARVSPDEHLPRQHKNVVQIQVEQGQREHHPQTLITQLATTNYCEPTTN